MSEQAIGSPAPAIFTVRPRAIYALFVLLVIYTFNYIDRYLVTGLAEPIKQEFSLTDSFVGVLLGPAFAVLYTAAGLPIARLADRISRVLIISLGCAVWSFFTVLSGLAADSTTFALMRLGVGLGEAAFLAPAYSLLADMFPPHRRALVYSVLGLAVYFGQVLGLAIGPLIADVYGWRSAFVWIGLPGVIVAAVFYFSVEDTQRSSSPWGRINLRCRQAPDVASTHSLLFVINALTGVASFRNLAIGAGLGAFSGYAFAMWGPTYFTRVLGMSLLEANLAFGLAFGLSGLVGMLLFGWLCDRLAVSDRTWPMRMSGIAMGAATVCVTLVCLTDFPTTALLIAIPSGLLGGGWAVGLMTTIQDVVPPAVRATAVATYGLVVTFVGLIGGPVTVGLLSDSLHAFGNDALRYALLVAISTGFVGSLLLMRGSRFIVSDRACLVKKLQ